VVCSSVRQARRATFGPASVRYFGGRRGWLRALRLVREPVDVRPTARSIWRIGESPRVFRADLRTGDLRRSCLSRGGLLRA
jgi:hypothetical protein